MAQTSYKANAMSRELADLLRKQCQATLPVVVESFDADANPVITLSADATPVAGEKVIVIRTKPIEWPTAKDILGNTALRFSGHTIQICTENNATGGAGADILDANELLPVLFEVSRKGTFVQWFKTTNGTVPSVTAINSQESGGTGPQRTVRDLYWNLLKAV